jgi:hypothetical protein
MLKNRDVLLGLSVVALALLILFVWIPNDIDTGLIHKVRRVVMIGDSFAPTFAAVLLALSGVLLVLEARRSPAPADTGLESLRFSLSLLAIFAVTFAIMRWAGPLATTLFANGSYRPLRNTFPWKYVGYLLGGTFLVAATSGMMLHRIGLRTILIAAACAIVLALLYDMPFGDLLLPPNGDAL